MATPASPVSGDAPPPATGAAAYNAVELQPVTPVGGAGADADRKAKERAEEEAEIRRQKLILIGGVKTKVTCSWQVMKRVARLMTMAGPKSNRLALYWFLALGALALYSWLNYQMSLGGGDFLVQLQNFGSLAYSSTNTSDENGTYTFEEQWAAEEYGPFYGPNALDDALSDTKRMFYRTCWEVALYTFAAAWSFAYILTCSHWMSQVLRDHITAEVFKNYFQGNVFFEINNFEKSLDNCDIRIATDIRLFTYWLSNTLFGTVYYNGVLPTLGSAISFTYLLAISAGKEGLYISYLSFAFFVVLNAGIASWTATSAYDMETANGFYANSHNHLRAHAEHVAFYRGQTEEKKKLLARLNESLDSTATYLYRFFWVNFATNFYYFLATILNYCLPGLIFFLGKNNSQDPASVNDLLAVTAYNSYLQLTFALSIFVTEAWGYTMSYATRVGELLEASERRAADAIARETSICYKNSDHIQLSKVHLLTPDNKTLIPDLTFRVEARQSLIIMGPSGSGKSSALRTICGLWPISSGEIQTPFTGGKGVFFLPQKPYLTLGTLREQFFYPDTTDGQAISDEQLRALLRMVELEYVMDRFNARTVAEWANVLSVGEQQRVGMARMFFHRPRFAILDEATSAVDNKMEEKFYTQCRELGITYISVAHRPACVRYHDALLRLDGKGGYTLSGIPENEKYHRSGKPLPPAPMSAAAHALAAAEANGSAGAAANTSAGADNGTAKLLVDVKVDEAAAAAKAKKEAEEDEAEIRRQKLILIGGKKSDVKCSMQVLRRVWRLITMTGPKNTYLAIYWALGSAILGLYAWINYQLSLGGGDFLIQLSNFGALYAVNDTDPNTGYTSEDYGPFATLDDALSDTKRMFYRTCWEVALYTFAAAWTFAMMLTCSHYISQVLREHITLYALDKYFTQNVFYEVNNFEKSIDNVDIRLSNDIRLFTFWWSNTIFGTVYYNGVFPTVAMAISFTILLARTAGRIGLYASYLSFLVFIVCNTIIGSWNADAAYEMDTDNGFYLNAHSHLRAHAEHVAFYRGQKEERKKMEGLLRKSQDSTTEFIFRFFFVNFASNFYYWLATILNYCLPGLIFFLQSGPHDPVTVTDLLAVTAYNSYLQLTFALCIFVTESWSYCMSYGTRIGELLEALESRSAAAEQRAGQVFYKAADHVELQHVAILTPDSSVLLAELSFRLEPRVSLIIMGPSGSGKSSVLRTMCGLWPISSGQIYSPFNSGKGVFFLPQKPYLTLGTLREQFSYPDSAESAQTITDDDIRRLLQMVDLEYLLTRFDARSVANWADILSVGEQQRIGMARMFYKKPTFAILDEATSAVDSLMEEKFYSTCRQLGMTYISVAHRPACVPYHDALLRLDGKGGYALTMIDEAMKREYAADPTTHGDGHGGAGGAAAGAGAGTYAALPGSNGDSKFDSYATPPAPAPAAADLFAGQHDAASGAAASALMAAVPPMPTAAVEFVAPAGNSVVSLPPPPPAPQDFN